tara:strand:- start:17 stop:487 length:471 start_codon:yes stop_codon:yes gene_type:complete
MPLEQDEPFHHSDRGERPHALLSHEDLGDRIGELGSSEETSGFVGDGELSELIQEHFNRKDENKIEPGVSLAELRELMGSLPSFYGDPPEKSPWMRFREQAIKDHQEGVGPDPYSGALPNTLQSNSRNWKSQPFDEEFQDLHRSDDVFDQAWGVVK